MDANVLSTLRTEVLLAAFAVSAVFGAVAQRTHFCTMGAISDVVNMGDWTRLRMWAMAIGVAMIGFHMLAALGVIDATQTIYYSGRVIWASALVGGALFGFGMVLGSGCGSKTLVRLGAGSLKALVVFVVMGVAAYATLRGLTAVLRDRTVDRWAFDMQPGSPLPAWLARQWGWPEAWSLLIVGLGVGALLILWAVSSAEFRRSFDAWLGGIGIGLTVVAMWAVSGWLGFVPEHPETLEPTFVATQSGRMEALTFTAPMAYTLDWLMLFSDANKTLTLGVVSVLGVVAGSAASALGTRTFHWEGFADTRDTALHIVGAVCMGVGGVTAMGCTIGQGLSGVSTLSVTSVLALVGIVIGALAGLRFQLWLLERD
ncbi:putative selenium metabolism protein, YedE family [Tepidimonas alkaliphilus]|uniref:Putative selenium metabolism protein, YedE family n=1 Tax=Tepidimonas alkaliphilus TaxID=2588942 RepID=A0A554W8N6_9BURK|nr:YeeE/YedE family protein [Tepidimonas alkaliphilus]TSE19935.1 putative selenium metabolism protein, YedE family [Tepidimonas alkaliphilus]